MVSPKKRHLWMRDIPYITMKNEDEHGRFMILTPWIQPYLPKGSIRGMIQGVKHLLRQCLDPRRVKLELSP